MTVIMLDIDHFRTFNELYGHDVGDYALHLVADAIRQSLRRDDSAARYGGEEFTIILPDTDVLAAAEVAERIRATIAQQQVVIAGQSHLGIGITASLGYATFPQHAAVGGALLKAADLALYHSKHTGRNRATAYSLTLVTEHERNAQAA